MKSQQPRLTNNYLLDDVDEYDKLNKYMVARWSARTSSTTTSRQAGGYEEVEAGGDVRPGGADYGEIDVELIDLLLNNNWRRRH
eukprot:5285658-Heterocapsa_arctica.AAC.1